jgi:hypothetical protein
VTAERGSGESPSSLDFVRWLDRELAVAQRVIAVLLKRLLHPMFSNPCVQKGGSITEPPRCSQGTPFERRLRALRAGQGRRTMSFDYDLLLSLTREVPRVRDHSHANESVPDQVRDQVIARDGGACRLCRFTSDRFGTWSGWNPDQLGVHHVLPGGPATPENLVSLCTRCHKLVHHILVRDGKRSRHA